MRKSFLYYVSEDIIRKFGCDLSQTAIVFPNKRASLFMNECLIDKVDKPIWSPVYITISELFRQHSKLTVADHIKLICDLYKSFQKFASTNETLDHFYNWGQLLLSDFDDIDKNMADAKNIFINLRNIHELDDISYLTNEQRELIKRFFNNFKDEQNSELKQRFINLWQHFENIYIDFNTRLLEQGLTYEGALYRSVADDENIIFNYERYIFIGFNMLHEVEKRIFSRLQKEDKAFFYWDFDKYYMPNPNKINNEAGHYIHQYLKYFPNQLDNNNRDIYDNFSQSKQIKFISAATENIQARYVEKWLMANDKINAGKKTAIVMCDEALLLPVLHSLPIKADKVNITSGYPIKLTPIASIIINLIDLQTKGYHKQSKKYKQNYVDKVLRHPYISYISDRANYLRTHINENKIYFISSDFFNIDEKLSLVFSPILSDKKENYDYNLQLVKWLTYIVKQIGVNSRENDDPLLQESVFKTYTMLARLASLIETGDLIVDTSTLRRLVKQLIDTTNIPFHGEPAVGVQVMGILETRNLDFDNILLLSCNDGKMPQSINDASFIPYSIRKSYGLTTIDNKISIYSYYFHSLLQRANNITITYNNSTENGHTGEMSRFMLQLMVESGHSITRENLQTNYISIKSGKKYIEKTHEVIKILDKMNKISPSAINQYLRCQLQFFYNYVAKIKEPDNNEAINIDNRMFGNIFHKSAFYIYNKMIENCGNIITKSSIDYFLNHRELIERLVDKAFNEELFKTDDKKQRSEYNGLQIINREVIISYLEQLLESDRNIVPITILGLEQKICDNINFTNSSIQRSITIEGYIDRIDMIGDGSVNKSIRVIDYKTGRLPSSKINTLKEVFSSDDINKKHTDYYLQAMLYSIIVNRSKKWNPKGISVRPALLFIQQSAKENNDPTLHLYGTPIDSIEQYSCEFMELLSDIIGQMMDPKVPFSPTQDKTRCDNCAYKHICEI